MYRRAHWLAMVVAALAVPGVGAGTSGAPRCLAVTFDDGPRPAFLHKALDILDQYGVKATFFAVGENVKAHPGLIAQCVRRGHEVENHSYDHPQLSRLSADRIRWQLDQTNQLIQAEARRRPEYLRPPYGAQNKTVREVAKAMDLGIAMWSVDPFDWQGSATPRRTASRVLSHLHRNAVVLMHEVPATLAALPTILAGIQSRGYTTLTYRELMVYQSAPPARQIVVHCGAGNDDLAQVATGFAYLLERGLRSAAPPRWSGPELRFRLVLPAHTAGTLKVVLGADPGKADAQQKVSLNGTYLATFAGARTVLAALSADQTAGGEVTVTVQGVNGALASVTHIAFDATRA